MSPDQIRHQDLYPKGFYPLPYPKHQEGGFVFPHFLIDAIKQQDGRNLTRFDIDLPHRFLAEFPPTIYLTPRPSQALSSSPSRTKTTDEEELFVLKMEEENAGSGRRSYRPIDPNSPRSNL